MKAEPTYYALHCKKSNTKPQMQEPLLCNYTSYLKLSNMRK